MAIDLTKCSEADVGRWVRFDYQHGESVYGKFRYSSEKYAFVVFSCNSDWDNFQAYTSESCDPEQCTFVESPEVDIGRAFQKELQGLSSERQRHLREGIWDDET